MMKATTTQLKNSTFVSLLSNESWVPGALCLLKALGAVRSLCPLLLVIDDVTQRGSQTSIPDDAFLTVLRARLRLAIFRISYFRL